MQLKHNIRFQNPNRFYMKGGGGIGREWTQRWHQKFTLPVDQKLLPEASLIRCETWDLYEAVKETATCYRFAYNHLGRRYRNTTVDGALLVAQLQDSFLVILWKNQIHVVHHGSADIWNPTTKKYKRVTEWLESTQKGKR